MIYRQLQEIFRKSVQEVRIQIPGWAIFQIGKWTAFLICHNYSIVMNERLEFFNLKLLERYKSET